MRYSIARILFGIFIKSALFPITISAAFCLAATGVVLIITKGDLSVVNFSYSGVLWGLASAACGAFCTLQPGNAVKKLGVNAVVGFGMLFAGIGALFVYPPTEIDAVWTWETLAGYLYIIVVGTALAFVCYLKTSENAPARKGERPAFRAHILGGTL